MTDERNLQKSLEPAQIERLQNLIDEAMQMHIALGRLVNAEEEHHECCFAALGELHDAMGSRLVRAANIVCTGDEEGNIVCAGEKEG